MFSVNMPICKIRQHGSWSTDCVWKFIKQVLYSGENIACTFANVCIMLSVLFLGLRVSSCIYIYIYIYIIQFYYSCKLELSLRLVMAV